MECGIEQVGRSLGLVLGLILTGVLEGSTVVPETKRWRWITSRAAMFDVEMVVVIGNFCGFNVRKCIDG